jgi:hypothetical protein
LRASWLLASAVLLATASVSPAITISFSGSFTQDDDRVLFQYSIQNDGLVTIRTTSFAAGGFSPILSLFESNGHFVTENVGYSNSPISDAEIPTWFASAGTNYFIVLSQWLNQSIGGQHDGNLSEGFLQDGAGNYTGDNAGVPGGAFYIEGPEQRTNNWAVEFSSADPTLQASIPEPSTLALGSIGAVLVYGLSRVRRRTNSSST